MRDEPLFLPLYRRGGRNLPDARNPFAANASSKLGITHQFAQQSPIFQIGANCEHHANQCIRTCRDHMVVAIGLDLYDVVVVVSSDGGSCLARLKKKFNTVPISFAGDFETMGHTFLLRSNPS